MFDLDGFLVALLHSPTTALLPCRRRHDWSSRSLQIDYVHRYISPYSTPIPIPTVLPSHSQSESQDLLCPPNTLILHSIRSHSIHPRVGEQAAFLDLSLDPSQPGWTTKTDGHSDHEQSSLSSMMGFQPSWRIDIQCDSVFLVG